MNSQHFNYLKRIEFLGQPIDNLELDIQTHYALRQALPEIKQLWQLSALTENDLLVQPGIRHQRVRRIKEALLEHGLRLAG